MFGRTLLILSLTALLGATPSAAANSGGPFTYQAVIRQGGTPFSGSANITVGVWDALIGGTELDTNLFLGHAVVDGLLNVDLSFAPGTFDGSGRWLQVEINGAPLSPRQPVMPTPYAMLAGTAATVPDGALPASYTSAVDLSNAANQFAGSGAGLTSLNASNIDAGTIDDTRLSSNVALLNLPPTFNTTVNASDASQASFRTLSSTYGGMYFANTSGISQGSVSFAHGADELRIANRVGTLGGTFHEIILKDDGATVFPGNVGLGTSAPQRQLDIEGPEAMMRLVATDPTPGLASRFQFKASAGPSLFHPMGFIEFYDETDVLRSHISSVKAGPTAAQMHFNVTPGAVSQLTIGTNLVRAHGKLEVRRSSDFELGAQIGSDGQDSYMQLQGGYLGVGTDTPSSILHVVNNSGGGAPVVRIDADGKDCLQATTQDGFAALRGDNMATNQYQTIGVFGKTVDTDGIAVRGDSTGAGATGIFGWALDDSAAVSYGVWGRSDSPNGYGVYSSGDAHVNGTLSKSGGAFRIDHPLDPENKELWHSFVESPDMMSIYNGNVTTDGDGYATVTMPEWFEALNRDFRYQLTVIDESEDTFVFAKVYRRLENNQFSIKTSEPWTDVSWQVTGVRQDPWANANRIPTEVEKREEQRGFYLSPEAYGLPRERGVDGQRMPAEPTGGS